MTPDIHALAHLAAADTGLTISRIRPSPRTPVRPRSRVANIREWQQRYACDELRDDDPPPIAQPGAFMLYVAASAFGAVKLEKWFRARGGSRRSAAICRSAGCNYEAA